MKNKKVEKTIKTGKIILIFIRIHVYPFLLPYGDKFEHIFRIHYIFFHLFSPVKKSNLLKNTESHVLGINQHKLRIQHSFSELNTQFLTNLS